MLKNVFDYLQQYLVVRLEQSVTRDLRNRVYDAPAGAGPALLRPYAPARSSTA
jgi:hypothetical protein